MYSAIQAYNIAQEKQHHRYYQLYKRNARIIMRHISKAVNRGETFYCFCGKKNTHMEMRVLKQLDEELTIIGYVCNVYYDVNEKTNKKVWKMSVKWRA